MTTPSARRDFVQVLVRRGISQRKALSALGLSRRIASYAPRQPAKDQVLAERLLAASPKVPRFGYRRMAAWLKQRLPKGAVVLVSPARRAQQTAQALIRKYETSDAVGSTTTPEAVLAAAGWPDGKATVIVVGHQPTLGAVAALALTGRAMPWSVKKGALWWLERRERDAATVLRAVISPDLL